MLLVLALLCPLQGCMTYMGVRAIRGHKRSPDATKVLVGANIVGGATVAGAVAVGADADRGDALLSASLVSVVDMAVGLPLFVLGNIMYGGR